jgi:endo-cleaving rubber dioxygenase
MFDQFVRALAMLFLDKGTSPTASLITIPTADRPGA